MSHILGNIAGGLAIAAVAAFVWWITGPMPGDTKGKRE